jgi:hypothetical protein
MTTTQIIVAVCGFSILSLVSMVVYIWKDLRSGVKNSVTQQHCTSRSNEIETKINNVCADLGSHYHKPDGKAVGEL